jgi:hypothetical protein
MSPTKYYDLHLGEVAPAPPAGGPDAWYGPTPTNNSYESAAVLCEKITITTGGSLTKVGVYIVDKGTADIKLALYDSTGATLLSSGGVIANASITTPGYNDYTLGTPVTVTNGQVVLACFRMSAEVQHSIGADAAGAGYYKTDITYAAFPEATISLEDSGRHNILRVYVD